MLYEKYNLTQEEIDYIESTIKSLKGSSRKSEFSNHMIEKLSSPFFLPEKKGLLSCY